MGTGLTDSLISCEVRRGIAGGYPFAKAVVPPLTELLPRARAAGALVVFVHFAFRRNGSDVPSNSPLMRSFFEAGDAFHEGPPGTEIGLPGAGEGGGGVG